MKLASLSINDLADVHLSTSATPKQVDEGFLYSSLPGLALETNQAHGISNVAIFSPLLTAFAILDQLGCSYKPTSAAPYFPANASGVKKALHYFCGLAQGCDELEALFGLRNSFIHDGSTLSRGRQKDDGTWKGPFHVFRLDRDPNAAALVKLPHIPWDMSWAIPPPLFNGFTIVYSRVLSRAALDAVEKASRLLHANSLEVIVKDPLELFHKYLFLRNDA